MSEFDFRDDFDRISEKLFPGQTIVGFDLLGWEAVGVGHVRMRFGDGEQFVLGNIMKDVAERLEVGTIVIRIHVPSTDDSDWKTLPGGVIDEVNFLRSPDLDSLSVIQLKIGNRNICIAAGVMPFNLFFRDGEIEFGESEYHSYQYAPLNRSKS
jgi:hypothetical protein